MTSTTIKLETQLMEARTGLRASAWEKWFRHLGITARKLSLAAPVRLVLPVASVLARLKWLRLSEQDFRFDRWSICRD